jgi:hypothetical protein
LHIPAVAEVGLTIGGTLHLQGDGLLTAAGATQGTPAPDIFIDLC